MASIVISLSSILTTIFASITLTGRSLGETRTVGLFADFAGVVPVTDPVSASSGLLGPAQGLSTVLIFLAMMSFVLGTILTRPLRGDPPV